MLFRKILPAIIILSAAISYSSCDNAVDPGSRSVTGKVYGYYHTPIENLKVTIQDRSVFTSTDGNFSLNGISYPYDVIITDSANRKASVFKNISVDNIALPLKDYGSNSYYFSLNVQIDDDGLTNGKKWKVIFTDKEFVNVFDENCRSKPFCRSYY